MSPSRGGRWVHPSQRDLGPLSFPGRSVFSSNTKCSLQIKAQEGPAFFLKPGDSLPWVEVQEAGKEEGAWPAGTVAPGCGSKGPRRWASRDCPGAGTGTGAHTRGGRRGAGGEDGARGRQAQRHAAVLFSLRSWEAGQGCAGLLPAERVPGQTSVREAPQTPGSPNCVNRGWAYYKASVGCEGGLGFGLLDPELVPGLVCGTRSTRAVGPASRGTCHLPQMPAAGPGPSTAPFLSSLKAGEDDCPPPTPGPSHLLPAVQTRQDSGETFKPRRSRPDAAEPSCIWTNCPRWAWATRCPPFKLLLWSEGSQSAHGGPNCAGRGGQRRRPGAGTACLGSGGHDPRSGATWDPRS